ncbi:OLC1v1036739C1 [Oldenlandia corymbosa var. corymbosa]|uniref:OLC1v1036739C1 n=1 Tax=Oldenlandia corymbosa var. corymbosa TaxID=529605 RepID=A0AAV1CZB8_OLDCO|nr:OLC1v1036739C1 [Oldenlandia corymbosa var. corymbosa]
MARGTKKKSKAAVNEHHEQPEDKRKLQMIDCVNNLAKDQERIEMEISEEAEKNVALSKGKMHKEKSPSGKSSSSESEIATQGDEVLILNQKGMKVGLVNMNNIMSWNIRGLNSPLKHREVTSYLSMNKVGFAWILETKLIGEKAKEIVMKKWHQYEYYGNHEGKSKGSILVLWRKEDYEVQIQTVNKQYIHCWVKNLNTKCWFYVTVVYADYLVQGRIKLWEELKQVADHTTEAWLIMGDFNCVTNPEERLGGRKQVGDQSIMAKLDRILGNGEWFNQFSTAYTTVSAAGISNHNALIVRWGDDPVISKKSFRFFNMWTQSTEFQSIVKEVWQKQITGTTQFRVVSKQKLLKKPLRDLNRRKFENVEVKYQECHSKLIMIQDQLSLDPENVAMQKEEKQARDDWHWKKINKIKEVFALGTMNGKWQHNGGKNYNATSGYRWLRGDQHKFQPARVVWTSVGLPKHNFISWMACHDRLLTVERLQKMTIQDLLVCHKQKMYKKDEEENHLIEEVLCAQIDMNLEQSSSTVKGGESVCLVGHDYNVCQDEKVDPIAGKEEEKEMREERKEIEQEQGGEKEEEKRSCLALGKQEIHTNNNCVENDEGENFFMANILDLASLERLDALATEERKIQIGDDVWEKDENGEILDVFDNQENIDDVEICELKEKQDTCESEHVDKVKNACEKLYFEDKWVNMDEFFEKDKTQIQCFMKYQECRVTTLLIEECINFKMVFHLIYSAMEMSSEIEDRDGVGDCFMQAWFKGAYVGNKPSLNRKYYFRDNLVIIYLV